MERVRILGWGLGFGHWTKVRVTGDYSHSLDLVEKNSDIYKSLTSMIYTKSPNPLSTRFRGSTFIRALKKITPKLQPIFTCISGQYRHFVNNNTDIKKTCTLYNDRNLRCSVFIYKLNYIGIWVVGFGLGWMGVRLSRRLEQCHIFPPLEIFGNAIRWLLIILYYIGIWVVGFGLGWMGIRLSRRF